MKPIRRIFISKILLSVIVFLCAINVYASVECWYIVENTSKVFINFSANYSYFNRSIPLEYWHNLSGLEYVRGQLVLQKKIQDIPILIVIPSSLSLPEFLSKQIKISLEEEGFLLKNEGESQDDKISIGRCYKIYIPVYPGTPSYENLLLLLISTVNLSPEKREILITDISQLEKDLSAGTINFHNIIQHFDPVWSPDGKSVAYTVWQDGKIHLEVISFLKKSVRKIEPMDGYIACDAIWSQDSRYLACASLKEIKIFDTFEDKTQTIPILPLLQLNEEESFYLCEILISFDTSGEEFLFSTDKSLFLCYDVYSYNLKQKNITVIAKNTKRPEGAERWKEDKYRVSPVVKTKSPDNRYTASIKQVNGLNRIEVVSINHTEIAVDLENDGQTEVLFLEPENTLTLTVYHNNEKLWEGIPKKWKPWKLETADVDGDGILDIILGVYKKTRFFSYPHNCLFVFGWNQKDVFPKWLGSRLSKPFVDFTFAEVDGKNGAELISIEKTSYKKYCIVVYRWCGFGFAGNWQSESFSDIRFVENNDDKPVMIVNKKEKLILAREDGEYCLKKLNSQGGKI